MRPTGGERQRAIIRRAVLASGVSAAAAAVAACGGSVQPAAGQTGAVKRASPYTVHVQVWGAAPDKDVYDAIRADFNATHTGVTLENDHQDAGAGAAGYFEKLAAGLAAGTAADLVYFQGWTWQEYAGKGALQPLDELAQRDRWSVPWPNDEAYTLQTRFRGKRYLSPSNAGTMVMYYVKEYFDKAGLSYPRADWTYAEFQDLCRKLTREIDGRPVYAYQWNAGYLRNTPWWRMHRQLEWDRVAEPRRAAWNTAAVIEAYQYQLYDSQYRLRTAPTQDLLTANPAYYRVESGGAAMKVDGPWLLPRMWGPAAQRQGGTSFDVQLLPTGKMSKKLHINLLGGQAMTKMSRDKEAAWDAMKWIASDDGQRRVAQGGRMCNTPDANRKFWVDAARKAYNLASAEVFLQAIEGSTFHLVGEITEHLLDRDAGLAQTLDDIRDGKTPAKEALDRLQPRIQRVLDAYWAAQPGGA